MGQEQSTVGGGGFVYEDPLLQLNALMPQSQQTFVTSSNNPDYSFRQQQHHNQPAASAVANSNSNLQSFQPPEEEVIDIYDTGVSKGLLALLATLHHDDEISTTAFPSESSSAPRLSAAAPEFVPGGAGASRWLNAAAPEFVPGAVSGVRPSAAAPTRSVPALVDQKTWWYKDPKGINRGPFSTSEMKAWSDQNYFPKDLMVARDENGPFISLAALFADSPAPFARYMDVREFNLKQLSQTL
jgi:hypothetical protein